MISYLYKNDSSSNIYPRILIYAGMVSERSNIKSMTLVLLGKWEMRDWSLYILVGMRVLNLT